MGGKCWQNQSQPSTYYYEEVEGVYTYKGYPCIKKGVNQLTDLKDSYVTRI